jgi:hypothetical protein
MQPGSSVPPFWRQQIITDPGKLIPLDRELINLLDGQLARVRYASTADVLSHSGEMTPCANNGHSKARV